MSVRDATIEQGITVSRRLADWMAGLDVGDLPAPVRDAVAATVVDTAGLSVAAAGADYARSVRAAADADGPCTVFGAPERRSACDAALINGTTGHGEDFDNTYEGCPVHSGVVVVPALCAAGERHGLSGRRVALGMTVAIEVMCRLGAVAQKGVHKQGFHPTSVLGTVAAAAGVAVARGLDARQVQDAIGIAASMSSGIIEYLADGTWTKRMHPGWAAQSAIRAAAMAAAGFRGPASAIEGAHGLYAAFAPSVEPDLAALVGGLGERWEAANVAFKPYACGTMTQPFIDCAVRLARRGVDPADIEEVVCKVGEGTVHRLWAPLELKQRPPTPYAAKFSGPYTVASGFVYGGAGLSEFTEAAISDPRVRSLAAKVRYEVDPMNEYPANYTGHVAARMRGGDWVSEDQWQLRGGLREPMSRDDLVAKCAANLAFGGWAGADAAAIAAFADGLFTQDCGFSAALLARD